MATDVRREDRVAFDVKRHPQIAFDHDRIDGWLEDSRKRIDFVSSQAQVKRVALENLPRFLCRSLLAWGEFFVIAPELRGGFVLVAVYTGG